MIRVYWMSRHPHLPAQEAALEKLAGEPVEIIHDPRPFASADDLVERFRRSGCDDLVVVAPLSVIAVLCQRGLRPLWAQMELVDEYKEDGAHVIQHGRIYRFERFRRIERVVVEYSDDVRLGDVSRE